MTANAADLDQADAAFRFDWGPDGLDALAAGCDVIVVVDVLRFTTAVSAAIEAGVRVHPYVWNDDRAAAYAAERRAILAGDADRLASLSPGDLASLPRGSAVVLPSPNGSSLAFEAIARGVPFVLAGCLRNAAATARRALLLAQGGPVGVIAAGERRPDGSVRPAVEDLLGAGAVLASIDPSGSIARPRCSPEASAARAAFLDARPLLSDALHRCASGRELTRVGRGDDVDAAAALDATDLAAQLVDDAFVAV